MLALSLMGLGACKHDAAKHQHSTAAATAGAKYSCPMDCEKGKTYDQAGTCPVCKMDLAVVPAAKYICPMDCEKGKTYDQAGTCPVCKMDLAPVKS